MAHEQHENSMKKFYESKTVWLGIMTAVLSVLAFLQGEEWIQEYPQIVALIGSAVGILTIALRFLTNKPMSFMQERKYDAIKERKGEVD